MRSRYGVLIFALLLTQPAIAQSNEASLEIHVPQPLSHVDLHWAKSALMLSEQQVAVVDMLYARYLENWSELYARELPLVRKLGVEAAPLFGSSFGTTAIDAFTRMEAARLSLVEKTVTLDENLWNDIGALLAEPQVLQLPRMKMQRDRQRCRLSLRDLRASRMDHIILLKQLHLMPEPGSMLDAVLTEYDAAMTPPFTELDKRTAKAERDMLQLAVDTLFAPDPPGPRQAAGWRTAAYQDGLKRIMQPMLRLQQRVATINHVFLPRIVEQLSQEQKWMYETAFRSGAYPTIYPDRTDPIGLFQEILNLQLPSGAKDAVRGVWLDYRSSYDALCRQLEREQDAQWEQIAMTRSTPNIEEFRARFNKLLHERQERNQAAVDHLASALPIDVRQDLADLIEIYRREAAAQVHRAPVN